MSGYSLWKFDPLTGKSKGKGQWGPGIGKGTAKGQGKRVDEMRVFTPINNNLLPWYGCITPECRGKWCIGNNPPNHCGFCRMPCGYTRPLAGKGEPRASGIYQKGLGKSHGKDNGKGGKDNEIARLDVTKGKGNGIGKGKGKDNNEDKNKDKDNDEQQKEAYNKEQTLVFLNQLVANGSKDLADSISLNTGIFIPIARPKDVEKDLYTNYVQATNLQKRLKNDLESQLGN
jgi:hypothetical protein